MDDVLDSYYIFFCDFDDDEINNDLINFDLNYYSIFDNNDSLNFINDFENEKFLDFFNKYYILLSEFFFFLTFFIRIVF